MCRPPTFLAWFTGLSYLVASVFACVMFAAPVSAQPVAANIAVHACCDQPDSRAPQSACKAICCGLIAEGFALASPAGPAAVALVDSQHVIGLKSGPEPPIPRV
jgi:hypothetical protein